MVIYDYMEIVQDKTTVRVDTFAASESALPVGSKLLLNIQSHELQVLVNLEGQHLRTNTVAKRQRTNRYDENGNPVAGARQEDAENDLLQNDRYTHVVVYLDISRNFHPKDCGFVAVTLSVRCKTNMTAFDVRSVYVRISDLKMPSEDDLAKAKDFVQI
jgi:hypothetical protein